MEDRENLCGCPTCNLLAFLGVIIFIEFCIHNVKREDVDAVCRFAQARPFRDMLKLVPSEICSSSSLQRYAQARPFRDMLKLVPSEICSSPFLNGIKKRAVSSDLH